LYTNPERKTKGDCSLWSVLGTILVELNRINFIAVPLRLTPFLDCRICDLYVQNCYRNETVK